jgi:outer membrane receptor protein involved in Fe transport
VNIDLLWRHRVATAYLRAGGRSRVLDVEPNWGAAGGLFYAPGFGVADAGIAIHAARQVDLLARADNLFDRQYEAVFGYPAPRRSFTVGVRLAAGR